MVSDNHSFVALQLLRERRNQFADLQKDTYCPFLYSFFILGVIHWQSGVVGPGDRNCAQYGCYPHHLADFLSVNPRDTTPHRTSTSFPLARSGDIFSALCLGYF